MIRAEGLHKYYRTQGAEPVEALRDVSFEVKRGEFICLVGRSGCGKSTLLKMLAGLLPRTSGVLELAGKDIQGPSADVGMVFQAPVLMPWRTILDNVLLPIEFRRQPVAQFRERAFDLLEMVGLKDFAERFPHELSGGMQQRASIVRSLIADPPILLMDEPFGALDAMTREQMGIEVQQIWQSSGKTVIFVTHSISEAIFLGDRVFVMTPRPGTLAEIVDIDLPRPRSIATINSDAFGVYSSRVRHLLDAKGDISS